VTPHQYLQGFREDVPAWLDRFSSGDAFPRQDFFDSRIVFYPGSGTDGQPVKLFGATHSAHCFVYADYGVAKKELEATLEHPSYGFRGYHRVARLNLDVVDLTPRGWSPLVHLGELQTQVRMSDTVAADPFGFLEVLERNHELDENHGARRLAVLFLGADGIACYDALFCQADRKGSPFAVVLADHGFGGNYDAFGRDSLLERIARRARVFPDWLLVAENTRAWEAFEQVPGVDGEPGGMHATPRFLYVKRET